MPRFEDVQLAVAAILKSYAVMTIESGWPTLIKNTRNIGDFTKWKDHDSYQKAFDRLLRDLKAEEVKEL